MQQMGTKNIKKKLSCPVCKRTKAEKFWAGPGYRLVRCKKCAMVWDFFPPDNLSAQYEENYFSNENPKGGYANYFEGMAINKKTFFDRLKKIEKKLGRKGKLLDVGCALGDCLDIARQLKWKDAEGVELSEYAYKFAKRKGLKVKNGTLQDVKYPDNYFDAVTMQDVIEHVPDPVSDLKRIHKILKPGGKVYLVTPDIDGLWSRLLGKYWYHYKPGEHIMYFGQKSITTALKEAGFKNIESSKTYHVMSLNYILNRMRYYAPGLFGFFLSLVKGKKLENMAFRVYAGEIEAWGEK